MTSGISASSSDGARGDVAAAGGLPAAVLVSHVPSLVSRGDPWRTAQPTRSATIAAGGRSRVAVLRLAAGERDERR